jgi:hypothetical protein
VLSKSVTVPDCRHETAADHGLRQPACRFTSGS